MSYGAQICFSKIDQTEIEDFFRKFKRHVLSKLNHIAKDNYIFSPTSKSMNLKILDYTSYLEYRYDNTLEATLDEYWAHRVFSYRWFYNKELGIIGVYNVPDCCACFFDSCVYFQNSCDQDYELKEWGDIKVFKDIYYKYYNMTDEQIIGIALSEGYRKEDITNIPYYKRSLAYQEIWNYFEDTLYDDDNAIYLSLFSTYDFKHIAIFLNACFLEL